MSKRHMVMPVSRQGAQSIEFRDRIIELKAAESPEQVTAMMIELTTYALREITYKAEQNLALRMIERAANFALSMIG